jgi:predicted AAA+ superfamily ATPase
VQVLELETLGWREIQSARRLGVPEVLWRGGFPELHANPKLDPTAFYRSYVATYLERDLRAILNVTSLRDFERFLRACALRSAQLLNKVDLARDVGVSAVTVNAWLGALQASNQVLLLEPWFTNKSKTLTKSPKLYLADTGLLCYLLNIHGTEELLKSPLLGAVWETFVFAELRKRSMARSGGWSINFYRDRGMEVDFVLESGPNLTLVEAKWGEHPDARDSRNLLTLEKLLGPRFKCKKQIVCNAPNRFPLADGTTAMSVNDISD